MLAMHASVVVSPCVPHTATCARPTSSRRDRARRRIQAVPGHSWLTHTQAFARDILRRVGILPRRYSPLYSVYVGLSQVAGHCNRLEFVWSVGDGAGREAVGHTAAECPTALTHLDLLVMLDDDRSRAVSGMIPAVALPILEGCVGCDRQPFATPNDRLS